MIVVINWKPNESLDKLVKFLDGVVADPDFTRHNYYLALPLSFLKPIQEKFPFSNLICGCRSMNSETPGSYTKNMSATVIKDAGAKFVLLGTSEARGVLGESNESISQKAAKVISEGIIPFLCFGETIKEHNEGKSLEVIRIQLEGCLRPLPKEQSNSIPLIYEAPWLSQAELKPSLEEIEKAYSSCTELIRSILGKKDSTIYPFFPDVEGDSSFLTSIGGLGFYFWRTWFISPQVLAQSAAPTSLSFYEVKSEEINIPPIAEPPKRLRKKSAAEKAPLVESLSAKEEVQEKPPFD